MKAVHTLGAATGSRQRSAFYLEHMTKTRLRPFRPLVYRLYLAVVHSGWVAARAASIAARRDPDKVDKVSALLRGHAAALRSVIQH